MTEDTLFCPIRKSFVAALPEEKVRQALIREMVQNLGYPLGHIAVEKELSSLPHLANVASLPKRRADIMILAPHLHPHHLLYPLLLIECKAVPITAKTARQIIGYNRFVQAPFLAIVNEEEAFFGFYNKKIEDFSFHKGFFPYHALLEHIKL